MIMGRAGDYGEMDSQDITDIFGFRISRMAGLPGTGPKRTDGNYLIVVGCEEHTL